MDFLLDSIYEQQPSSEELVLGFYEFLNECWEKYPKENKKDIKCGKGCSFCCHINVDIHKAEAELILSYLGAKGEYKNIKWDYFEAQIGLGIYERPKIEKSACAFLEKDGTCGIYDVRPMSCRKFFVVNDPKQCDASKNDAGKTQTIQIQTLLDMEIAAAVLNLLLPDIDVMADVFLKLRK